MDSVCGYACVRVGDTPNSLTDDQFQELGNMSEGYSGSDISVVVREAIMEPLRKCQQAKQFITTEDGMLAPCEDYPNCPYCPIKLSSEGPATPPPSQAQGAQSVFNRPTCQRCGAVRMTLYDIDTNKLKVPVVVYQDFSKALTKAHSSVAGDELERFVKWTEEFGQEG